jgi:hypothetical protein
MLSSLVFRAVRDALPGKPAAQERIIGASLFAMAVADVRLPLLPTYLMMVNFDIVPLGYSVRYIPNDR